MFLAQKLYEASYITYIRTDSCYLSVNAINKVRRYIKKFYSDACLHNTSCIHTNKKHS